MADQIKSQIAYGATESLWPSVLNWSSKDWLHRIENLTNEQIASIMPAATSQHDPLHWHEKLAAAISGVTEKTQLEEIGKAITLEQASEVIPYAFRDSSTLDKLPPLLVGMSSNLFSQLMATMSPLMLEVLKHEALTEPIQYHLNILANSLSQSLKTYIESLEALERKFNELDLSQITREDIISETENINLLSAEGKEALKILSGSLAIAWNTLRIDLIEQLSKIKEQYQRLIQHDIGTRQTEDKAATGLFLALKKRLNTVFENTIGNNQKESLSNETPAIEAIVKFGIWYISDYVDIGLLNQTDLGEHHPETGNTLQEEIYKKIYAKLNALNLKTLSDLKKNLIYSKKELTSYIKEEIPSTL